jgi:hypothetical protein
MHQRPEWQIAAEMLLEAVEGKGPLMFAEIAMRKAVNAGKPPPELTPRRKAKLKPGTLDDTSWLKPLPHLDPTRPTVGQVLSG